MNQTQIKEKIQIIKLQLKDEYAYLSTLLKTKEEDYIDEQVRKLIEKSILWRENKLILLENQLRK